MSSSEDSVNNNDDNLVCGFFESTCSGDSVCDILDNEDELITEYSIVWVNNNKVIFQGGSLKFLPLTCHSITTI